MYRFIPVVFSCMLVGAHFLRGFQLGPLFTWLAIPLLLFIKRKWVTKVVPTLLIFGALIWVNTAIAKSAEYLEIGKPATRMLIILGCVALFTALSGLVFKSKAIKSRYDTDKGSGYPAYFAFMLTAIALIVIKVMTWPPAILFDRLFPDAGYLQMLMLSTYAALFTDIIMDVEKSRKWRPRLWLFFSFIFFTQLILGITVSDILFLMTGRLHLPVPALIVAGPLYRGAGYMMLSIFAASIVFVGPAWCSWLCYIGSWDFTTAQAKISPEKLPEWSKHMQLIILIVILAAAFILRVSGVPTIIAVYLAAAFGIVGVVLMFTWSKKTGVMTHCTTYCPIGIIACYAGKLNPFRIKISDKCSSCKECTELCRYDALSEEDINKGAPGASCTLCGDCLSACEDKCIQYTLPFISNARARALFVVLTISFHAVFLGVARI